MPGRVATFVVALWIACGVPRPGLVAQTFSTSATLVSVPLTVLDPTRSRLVSGLGPADFRVLEDGVEQTIAVVAGDRQAVSLCIVIDRSLSVEGVRQEASERAVDLLLEQLPVDDEVSLITFGAETTVELDWVRAGSRARVAWKNVPQGGGGSVLADALTLAMRQLERASNPRRVALVMSDGREVGSATPIRKLAATRRQSETQLFVFGLRLAAPKYPANIRYLQGMVGDSGGYVHVLDRLEDAGIAVHDLLTELDGQYLIGYAPTKPFDRRYRRVVVETVNRAYKVRHRGGYLAAP